jgi:N-acetyl-anhydromuramyl-L-alanine amidase AmpD
MTEKCTEKFLELVKEVAAQPWEFPHLKPFVVAQWILECGRGSTDLFKLHRNPMGQHYHDFMSGYATGVEYNACDGVGIYAKFANFENVTKSYFAWFDHWEHYGSWRMKAREGGLQFLKHIGPHYCPPGFTEGWKKAHGGLDYADYIATNLLAEAKSLLSTYDKPDSEAETITKIVLNRKDDGTPVATAYAGDTPRWTHIVEANSFEDFKTWCEQFSNAKLIGVEDTSKAFPKLPDYGVVVVEPDPVEKTEWIPFAKRAQKSMKTVEKRWPKYFIIHWTAGEPSQGGEDGIASGVKSGYTYLFLPRDGQVWQGAPTHAGGYHAGNASVSSLDCLGIEVANAGRVEKLNGRYVPWFAKNGDGSINVARCIPADQIIYDNDGPEDDGSFQGYYQKYTEAQVKSLTKLALYCVQVLGIPVANIRGHDEVATPHGRKVDPGASIGDGGMVGFRKNVAAALKQGLRWNSI